MMFNSIAFVLYLPIVFLLYWFVFRRLKWQNAFIVSASYLFYGWWDWRFLLLIAFTSLCSYFSGLLIESGKEKRTRKVVLGLNIVLNLGILCTFKYFNFFVGNLQALLSPIGVNLDSITLNLILPVGISFYTFQALSYSIDVYRGKIAATRDVVAFFAFISFFPQLVAGPIERATNLLPQFLESRQFSYPEAVDGCRRILWGFFKKLVIADNCATIANTVFNNYENLGALNLWIGALMFTFQIYGDFSGYSDIAIGVAKLFGIKLSKNFNRPYLSRDIAEFWRRWHISLNTWFVDYVYIPLGGSREGKRKHIRNIFAIFLLSGLWHGADWTFVAWGGWNALLFIPLTLTGRDKKHVGIAGNKGHLPAFGESTMMAVTFLLVMIGWVIFRADNIHHAWGYLCGMFHSPLFVPMSAPNLKLNLLFIAMMMGAEWIERHREHTLDFRQTGLLRFKAVRWMVYVFIALICLAFQGVSGEFIYFQF